MRKNKLSELFNVPLGIGIFVIIVGVLLGSVFVIIQWHDCAPVDISSAIPVTAVFDSYSVNYSPKGNLCDAEIYFGDYRKLYIPEACFDIDVENKLKNVRRGDKVDLLLHPNSDYILQMKYNNALILSFEQSIGKMFTDNIISTVIGGFCYLCAAWGIISVILKLKNRR